MIMISATGSRLLKLFVSRIIHFPPRVKKRPTTTSVPWQATKESLLVRRIREQQGCAPSHTLWEGKMLKAGLVRLEVTQGWEYHQSPTPALEDLCDTGKRSHTVAGDTLRIGSLTQGYLGSQMFAKCTAVFFQMAPKFQNGSKGYPVGQGGSVKWWNRAGFEVESLFSFLFLGQWQAKRMLEVGPDNLAGAAVSAETGLSLSLQWVF